MSSLQALQVLLVDDNQHMRAITSAVLQSAGVRKVREASDGAAGLEILREQAVDLAIVDFNMFPPGPQQPRHRQSLPADHHDDRSFGEEPRL